MVETGCAQVVRIASVGNEAWDVRVIRPQIEGIHSVGRLVDHDELLSERVERLGEQLSRAPVAGHQQERLTQARHLAGEPPKPAPAGTTGPGEGSAGSRSRTPSRQPRGRSRR